MPDERYCYSFDGVKFYGKFTTRGDAVTEAIDQCDILGRFHTGRVGYEIPDDELWDDEIEYYVADVEVHEATREEVSATGARVYFTTDGGDA